MSDIKTLEVRYKDMSGKYHYTSLPISIDYK